MRPMRVEPLAPSIRALLQQGAALLERRGISPARLEAGVLMARVLGMPRWRLTLEPDRAVSPEASATIRDLLRRRARHEPLQYLTSSQEFWGLAFRVGPGVFIPRPETEGLMEAALQRFPPCGPRGPDGPGGKIAPRLVVDLGTGSGCLAVALARAYPQARVVATDLAPQAVAAVRENAARHGVLERLTAWQGDLYAPLEAAPTALRTSPRAAAPLKADLIVSNPPYVPTRAWARLPEEIRLHEPREALDGGPDGLAIIQRLLAGVARYLAPGGLLLIELGAGQAAAVRRLARRHGLAVEAIERDLAGIPRVLVARMSPQSPGHGRQDYQWTA